MDLRYSAPNAQSRGEAPGGLAAALAGDPIALELLSRMHRIKRWRERAELFAVCTHDLLDAPVQGRIAFERQEDARTLRALLAAALSAAVAVRDEGL